ncbi:MAG: hypothetical protein AAGJ68_13215 [Pseudomonadota bacterium]
MSGDASSVSRSNEPKLDSLIEDVFGLNVQGFRTLGGLFVSTKAVFESARVSDWRQKYTPTIRLTFSIITVYMLLSFFWAAEDGIFYQSLYTQIAEVRAASENAVTPEQIREMVDHSFAAVSFLYPFVYMFFHGLLASCIFMWGKGTGWVTRIRLYFCLLAGGISVSLVTTMITPFLSGTMFLAFFVFSSVATLLTYVLIYIRGMWGNASAIGLSVRGISLSILIFTLDMIVSGLTAVAAGVWASLVAA